MKIGKHEIRVNKRNEEKIEKLKKEGKKIEITWGDDIANGDLILQNVSGQKLNGQPMINYRIWAVK